jgi:LacI family transcriptional regulator
MVKRITKEVESSATMADVAKQAGVSQATVSYVLNAKPGARVSPATRRRIVEVAEKLHYRPNAIARAMASGRSRTVGVYQPHIGHSPLSGMWTTAVMSGIGEALHARHFHLLLYGYRQAENPSPAHFLDGRVDALIILAPHVGDALPARLGRAGLPIAVVGGRQAPESGSMSVDVDNVEGGCRATEHLIRLGHTVIAHLAGPKDVPNAADRRTGYERAMLAHGLPPLVIQASFSEGDGYAGAREALTRQERPSALFAANDASAIGALQACADLGLCVPQDVAVIGYDDSPMCVVARPPLSSMRQPMAEMGRAAGEMLLDLLHGEPVPQRQRRFIAELVERESTVPAAQ